MTHNILGDSGINPTTLKIRNEIETHKTKTKTLIDKDMFYTAMHEIRTIIDLTKLIALEESQ